MKRHKKATKPQAYPTFEMGFFAHAELPSVVMVGKGWNITGVRDMEHFRRDGFNVTLDVEFAQRMHVFLGRAIAAARLKIPTVERGHCGRCDRCGHKLAKRVKDGCVIGKCSLRPTVEKRAACAGCGAPYRGLE